MDFVFDSYFLDLGHKKLDSLAFFDNLDFFDFWPSVFFLLNLDFGPFDLNHQFSGIFYVIFLISSGGGFDFHE